MCMQQVQPQRARSCAGSMTEPPPVLYSSVGLADRNSESVDLAISRKLAIIREVPIVLPASSGQ